MASAFDRISAALSSLGKRREPDSGDRTPSSSRPSSKQRAGFRPHDQRDLIRRLETYRPLTWFAKPDIVGPIACASRGWVNESRDTLSCEFCAVKLLYPQNTPLEHRQRAVEMFSEQLTSKHSNHCPWRSAKCADKILAFAPEEGPEEQRELFNTRVERLDRLDMLPDLCEDSLQPLISNPVVEQAISTPTPHDDAHDVGNPMQPAGSHHAGTPRKLSKHDKARLLAILGWETETLASDVSAMSALRLAGSSINTLGHLLGTKKVLQPEAGKQSMMSTVLGCPSCRSRVGLWNYASRPPMVLAGQAEGSSNHLSHTIAGGSFGGDGLSSRSSRSSSAAGSNAAVAAAGSTFRFGSSQSVAPVFGLAAFASLELTSSTSEPNSPAVLTGHKRRAAEGGEPLPATADPKRSRLQHGTPGTPMPVTPVAGPSGTPGMPIRRLELTPSLMSPSQGLGMPGAGSGTFDPVNHHRSWCPWVYKGADQQFKCGWMQLAESITAAQHQQQHQHQQQQQQQTPTVMAGADITNSVGGRPGPASGATPSREVDVQGIKKRIFDTLKRF